MAKNSNRGAMLLLILLIGFVTGIGVFFLDWAGVFNFKAFVMEQALRVPYIGKKIHKPDTNRPGVQRQEWDKIKLALSIEKKGLDKEKQTLEQLKKSLEEKEESLKKTASDLERKKKEFKKETEKYNTREARIKKQVKYYSIMKPTDSANLLPRLPQQMVIEILKRMDDELVVQILSLMDSEVAAELLRKMNKNH